MSHIYTSADQLIGRTPLLELTRIERWFDLKARILVKLEYFNPSGSVKDRIAREMLDDAEARRDPEARLRHHRAHLGQHRDRTGFRGGGPWIPGHPGHA